MADKGRRRLEAPSLRGSPRGLSGAIRLEGRQPVAPAPELPELSLDPASVAVAEMEAPDGERTAQIRLGVPETTPPGTYQSLVSVGETPVRVVLEVEPRARLRASPKRLNLTADPGQDVTGAVSISNIGNVAVEIPPTVRFGLFDIRGVERAIGRALIATPVRDERRVDILMEELAREHGGLVTSEVEGAGEILPGHVRYIGLKFTVPSEVSSGRTYYGVVRLRGGRFKLRIEIGEKAPRRPRRAPA
jgi:hypothetical protein